MKVFFLVLARDETHVSEKIEELKQLEVPYLVVCGERIGNSHIIYRKRKGKYDAINYGAGFIPKDADLVVLNDVDTKICNFEEALKNFRSKNVALVFAKSRKTSWYDGLSLIDTLDNIVKPVRFSLDTPLRGCVQDVYKDEDKELIICKIETGMLRKGEKVYISPLGKTGIVEAIDKFGNQVKEAKSGDSVGVILNDVQGVERGDVISPINNPASKAKSFIAEIILFSDIDISRGDIHMIRCGTAERKCKVEKILTEIDPVNLTVNATFPTTLKAGGVGEAKFSTIEPLSVEKYSNYPPLGRFVIEGNKGAIGAGLILEVEKEK